MVFKQAKQGLNKVNNNKDIKQSHSRMFLSGIFDACSYEIKGKIPELVSGSSTHAVAVIKRGNPLFNKRQGVEDPETSSGILNFITMNVARGFTLIELLVVVLIIGILAAVALPQYQKAVFKACATEAITILTAITNAQELYYLANNEYTDNIEDLDISVPTETSSYWFLCADKAHCYAYPKNNSNYPAFEFQLKNRYTSAKHYCRTAEKYCKLLGTKETDEHWILDF